MGLLRATIPLLAIGIPLVTPARAAAADAYADAAVCAQCHAAKARTYSQTGMGRSFYRMTARKATEDFKSGLPWAAVTDRLLTRRHAAIPPSLHKAMGYPIIETIDRGTLPGFSKGGLMRAIPLLAAWAAIAAFAQEAPQAQPRQAVERYAIYLDNSMYGAWNYLLDPLDPAAMHARYGHEYAWFRQGANQYVVNDPGVLDQLRQAVEPLNVIDRMKDQLNSEVRTLKVAQMAQMQASTARWMLESEQLRRSGSVDPNVGQAFLNRTRARVNEQQQKVIDLQQKVSAEEPGASADYSRRIVEILDSAVQRGLAQRFL